MTKTQRARSLDSFPPLTHLDNVADSAESRMQDRLILPSPIMQRDLSPTGLSPHRSEEKLTLPVERHNIAEELANRTMDGFALMPDGHVHRHARSSDGDRDRWQNRTEFILMLIGYTVGLGNVWRFPYLCHINGGASFLIPYGIMLAVEGIPLYYMELCIGQRMRKGSIGVWNEISPYLGGVGLASVMVCFLVSLYYNVIIAWCVFYFFKSFQNPLPWSSCPVEEVTKGNITIMEPVEECELTSATTYFWYRTTLGISSSIEDSGGMNWKLCACLVGTWMMVWLCMMKGIKITGKIVYMTATLPLILLIIFFFRGVHLKGYQNGLALLFIPEFNRLKDPLVWLDAAVQVFYSLGVAYGSLIAFSSYNPIKNDSTKDAITVCLINCATSIYASVVVFCFIGFEAEDKMERCLKKKHSQAFRLLNSSGLVKAPSVDMNELDGGVYDGLIYNASVILNETLVKCNKTQFLKVRSGQGLAFIIFTDAINKMPFAPIWAVMFFLMLITVGIDTEFGMLEGVVTPVIDLKLFPNLKKEYLSGVICLVSCLLGLPLVQYSGEYWFQLIDAYCSGIPLLIIALVECIAVCFIYGLDRFSDDIKYMTNKPPRFIWRWCWKVISPVAILAVLSMSIRGMSESTAQYNVWDESQGKGVKTPYPPWAKFLAIFLTLVSIFFIPAVAFLRYFRIIGMGTPELPAVVLDRDRDASELQPLYDGKTATTTNNKAKKLNFARRKFKQEKQILGMSPETKRNGSLHRVISANGQVYQLVNQHNGSARFL